MEFSKKYVQAIFIEQKKNRKNHKWDHFKKIENSENWKNLEKNFFQEIFFSNFSEFLYQKNKIMGLFQKWKKLEKNSEKISEKN